MSTSFPGTAVQMAQEKQLSRVEIRKTIATSLGAAFGFVIALVWNNVVQGGLKVAGVNLDLTPDLFGWLSYLVTAIVLTVAMIVLIIVIGRWGSKQ